MGIDLQHEASRLRKEADRVMGEAEAIAQKLRNAADLLVSADVRTGIPTPSGGGAADTQQAVESSLDSDSRKTVIDITIEALTFNDRPMSREELFDVVKRSGGKIASVDSFASLLSRAKGKTIFQLGKGMWGLEKHLSQQSGIVDGEPMLPVLP